jgi:hypothetical protein
MAEWHNRQELAAGTRLGIPITTDLVSQAAAVLGSYGSSDEAFLDIVFGPPPSRPGHCPSTCQNQWPPSKQAAPTSPTTPPTRSSGSVTASAMPDSSRPQASQVSGGLLILVGEFHPEQGLDAFV